MVTPASGVRRIRPERLIDQADLRTVLATNYNTSNEEAPYVDQPVVSYEFAATAATVPHRTDHPSAYDGLVAGWYYAEQIGATLSDCAQDPRSRQRAQYRASLGTAAR